MGLVFSLMREAVVKRSIKDFTRFSRNQFYPAAMRTVSLIIVVSVTFAGCASGQRSVIAGLSYPTAYQQALVEYPGDENVDPSVIKNFVDFLSNLGAADTGSRAAELYSPKLYFSDALMLTSRRSKVVEHFQGLVDNGASVEVTILRILVEQADVYLVWAMTAEFRPINQPVTSKTIGITHLRFDRGGQVILHQDFWDTGLGFYQQIPVLGRVIKGINSRFVAEDSIQ